MSLLPLLFCVIIAEAAGLPNRRSTDHTVCETDACRTVGESIRSSINKSIDPCTNFYEYGCGLWPTNNPISPKYLQWSTIHLIHSKTNNRLKGLLEEEGEYDDLEPIKKLKQYYRACMDEDAIEKRGLEPMQTMLDENGEWPIQLGTHELNNHTWQEIDNNYLKMFFVGSFISFGIMPDQEDSTKTIVLVQQSLNLIFGEQLVKRDESLISTPNGNKTIRVLDAFKEYKGIETPRENFIADVEDLLTFQRDLKNISEYEKEIQKGMKPDQDKMTIIELQEYYDQAGTQNPTSQINWLHMIQEILKPAKIDIDASFPVLVINKHLFHKLAHLLDTTPSHVIVNYVQWNIVNQLVPYLTKQMRDIEFETIVMDYNIPNAEQSPRWETCLDDKALEDALSFLFIKKYNSPETVTTVTEMVNDLKVEIKERILNSEWTNDNMKTFMIDKVDNIVSLIGYPAWYDNETALIERYNGLEIGENYIKNKIAHIQFENGRALLENLKTIKRTLWPLSPITLNAMYVPPLNSMVVPAAAVQEPFFTPGMPIAVNYGSIGMIVGHELAHSFDTTGIEYDKFGNKITSDAETAEAYGTRMKCYIDQYSNYTLFEKGDGKPVKLNGLLTKNENVADNIGLEIIFAAFQKRKLESGPQPKLPGLTDISDEELFFLAYANTWCMATDENFAAATANTDPHSPNKFRVLGAVANLVPFSETLNCPSGSPMNHDPKCTLWK